MEWRFPSQRRCAVRRRDRAEEDPPTRLDAAAGARTADVVGLTTALFIAEWMVAARNGGGTFSQLSEIVGFILTLPLWILVAKAYGLYDQDEERTDHSAPDEFSAIFHMVTVCTAGAALASYLTGVADPTPPKLVIFWSAAIVLRRLGESRRHVRVARRSPWYLQNTLIFGAGDVGQTIARKLLQHPEYGINLVGFVDDHPKERRDDLGNLTVIGGSSDLREVVELLDVERVIVAFSGDSDADTLQPDPNAERPGRPGRRGATPLRARLTRRRVAHGRGHPARRTSAA